MTDDLSNDDLASRVRELITNAVASLDPADRDARIAWCRERDQHGTRMHTDADGLLEFTWGGRRLALVRAADLASNVPLQAELIADRIPDTLPDDWSHQ